MLLCKGAMATLCDFFRSEFSVDSKFYPTASMKNIINKNVSIDLSYIHNTSTGFYKQNILLEALMKIN